MTERMPADRGFDLYADRAHFAALDGLRCIAIAAVLFHHSPLVTLYAPTFVLASRGFLGVDFFFIISGFLITTLLLRERARRGRVSLSGFYKRRALRILPLYYLLVTVVGAFFVLVRGMPGAAEMWPFYYLFLANFLIDDIPTLAPTWSLSVEEQYYLLWPLLLAVLPRRLLLWAVAVLIAVYVVLAETGTGFGNLEIGPLHLSFQLVSYLPILMGAALAMLLDRRESFVVLWRILGHRWASVGLAAGLLGALLFLPGGLGGWPYPIMHLTMTALIGSLVIREDSPLMPVLTLRPVVRIGMTSYGIYLLHHLTMFLSGILVSRIGGLQDHLVLFLALYWGGAILLAELSFRYYERPFLALRHKPLGFLPRLRHLKEPKGKLPS